MEEKFRSSSLEVFCKKGVLDKPQACKFVKKETSKQVFSCECYKIFKNSFFKRTHPVAGGFITYELRLVSYELQVAILRK